MKYWANLIYLQENNEKSYETLFSTYSFAPSSLLRIKGCGNNVVYGKWPTGLRNIKFLKIIDINADSPCNGAVPALIFSLLSCWCRFFEFEKV